MTEEAKKAVLMVHLDPELKRKLAVRAAENGISMSTLVRAALTAHLGLLDRDDSERPVAEAFERWSPYEIIINKRPYPAHFAPGHDPMTPTADELEREA